MIRIKRNKPMKGARKRSLKELPWKTAGKIAAAVLILGIMTYQFFELKNHSQRTAKTVMENLELNNALSTVTDDLTSERITFEAFITEQVLLNVELEDGIEDISSTLDETQEENAALLDQLAAARLQNDILRNKLDTMLGTASRNGSELTPSPMGPSGLTVDELKVLTKGTNLAGIEEALLQIEKEYNVNALYALAVAKLETGSGTSFLCNEHNNLFGMRGRDGWYEYETKQDSVMAFGKLMVTNYFPKGFDTIDKIGPRYAAGSQTWAIKAKYHMLRDMRRLHG